MPRIPLIDDLIRDSLPAGSAVLVEYDPASQWYNASVTIAAEWLRTGGVLAYGAAAQSPDKIRLGLKRLGLDPSEFERNGKLRIYDWYTATLGQKSKEKYAFDSVRVADLSIQYSKFMKAETPMPDSLTMRDDYSTLARFNDEKSWVEFALARVVPVGSFMKVIRILGVVRGVHSEWAYRTLETAVDGIIDFKLEEMGRGVRNLMRIRSMRNVAYDSEWHELKVGENFEVTLEK